MTPEELANLIKEALAPYRKAMEDFDNVLLAVMDDVEKLLSTSSLNRQELKTYIVDRVSDTRLSLMKDRDSFRGEPGPQGSSGTQGTRGDQGERGEKGDQGIQGVEGIEGIDGAQGTKGLQGQRGEQGYPGPIGEKGIQGERGDPGLVGGPGERGFPGKDGVKGEQGTQGTQGERGDQGIPGITGSTGIPGQNGHPGERGYRGEKGERGDAGLVGRGGEKGDRGERGFVGTVESWREKNYVAGEIVSHNGGSWQARRNTKDAPGWQSNSWEMLADGIGTVEWEDDCVIIRTAAGTVAKSAPLRGPKGEKGDSVVLHEKYDETQLYRKSLDEVKESGGVWRAKKDGLLHKPGTTKGKGQWTNIAHKGAKGDAGKDADMEVIKEQVIQHFAVERGALMDSTLRQIDEFFEGLDIDV